MAGPARERLKAGPAVSGSWVQQIEQMETYRPGGMWAVDPQSPTLNGNAQPVLANGTTQHSGRLNVGHGTSVWRMKGTGFIPVSTRLEPRRPEGAFSQPRTLKSLPRQPAEADKPGRLTTHQSPGPDTTEAHPANREEISHHHPVGPTTGFRTGVRGQSPPVSRRTSSTAKIDGSAFVRGIDAQRSCCSCTVYTH